MADPNIEMLKLAVGQLKELADELVFVGGCMTGLLITDSASAEVRATDDVDSIVEATTYLEYMTFTDRLQKIGFQQDTRDGAPLCRWVKGSSVLDVMPLDEKILGFTNKWYREAITSATKYEINPDVQISIISPALFCATKLEAFSNRGNSDYHATHDLEDLIAVIDGRVEIVDEIQQSTSDVRSYIASSFHSFLNTTSFFDALPGHLGAGAGEGRLTIVIDRVTRISKL